MTEAEVRVLRFLERGPRSRSEIADHLGLKSRIGHLKAIDHLRTIRFVEWTIPEKPQSKNQKMRITPAGRTWLAGHPATRPPKTIEPNV